jgi:hypothetical protein
LIIPLKYFSLLISSRYSLSLCNKQVIIIVHHLENRNVGHRIDLLVVFLEEIYLVLINGMKKKQEKKNEYQKFSSSIIEQSK